MASQLAQVRGCEARVAVEEQQKGQAGELRDARCTCISEVVCPQLHQLRQRRKWCPVKAIVQAVLQAQRP